MKPIIVIAAALVACAAQAADKSSEGRDLAERWCAPCHAVAADQPIAADAARTFPSLAADPITTEAGLRASMLAPHPPMPDPGLSEADLARIIAYIDSLKP